MCNSFLFQSHFVNFTVNFFALIRLNTITNRDNNSCSLFAATVRSLKYCSNHPVGYKSWNVCCIAVANIPGAPLGLKGILNGSYSVMTIWTIGHLDIWTIGLLDIVQSKSNFQLDKMNYV